jgi:putative methylase
VKRKRLEILLSSLKAIPEPKLRFEEYGLDPTSASTVLHIATSMDDIEGRDVIDLGCGTGILSIGAAIMGAKRVVGIDIDEDSVKVALENMKSLGVKIEFISGSIECIEPQFDTTVMNPPFGSWRRGLDIKFLAKALAISNVVYSIHKANYKSDAFLRRKLEDMGGEMKRLGGIEIRIPRLFRFHKKAQYKVDAALYRIVRLASLLRDNLPTAHLTT